MDVALRLGNREVKSLSVCCEIAPQRRSGRVVEANKRSRVTSTDALITLAYCVIRLPTLP